jgi:hypothetical protein
MPADDLAFRSASELAGRARGAALAGSRRSSRPARRSVPKRVFLEDRTTIDVARRLADVAGGFEPPPRCVGDGPPAEDDAAHR